MICACLLVSTVSNSPHHLEHIRRDELGIRHVACCRREAEGVRLYTSGMVSGSGRMFMVLPSSDPQMIHQVED